MTREFGDGMGDDHLDAGAGSARRCDDRVTAGARDSLSHLWYPLYAFLRSQGLGADDARDLTQAYYSSGC